MKIASFTGNAAAVLDAGKFTFRWVHLCVCGGEAEVTAYSDETMCSLCWLHMHMHTHTQDAIDAVLDGLIVEGSAEARR